MHELVSFNHRILAAAEAKISALSSAALYGSGVFTSIAIYNGKAFQWKKHWQRLTENAEKLNIRLSAELAEESVQNSLSELIEQNNLTDGRARITFFDEAASGIWTFETARRTLLLITTGDFRHNAEDFRLTLSPYRINSKSPLAGVKSGNYLENLLALEEAKSRRFDEAIRLNERGEMSSASMANLFWISDETIFTPSLETGCLEGTTRAFVIETAKELGFEIYTTDEHFGELRLADEVFITSAGLGIAGVRSIDAETYGDEITRRLQSEFAAKIRR
ncbi:MAG TPA: aminotransferase class IV [Pyrinomonadaceae bacterium]|jgi:branched-subunit amino acid aminotransferase/4-amino-4-deoxychorismate lyase